MAQQQMVREERSLGDLFSELASETGTLVRQEMALAQAELTAKASKAGKNIGFLVVGGVVAFTAALSLTAAVILLLSLWIQPWLAALLVSVVIGVAAYSILTSALSALRKTDPVPRETIETLKEDAEWLKKELT